MHRIAAILGLFLSASCTHVGSSAYSTAGAPPPSAPEAPAPPAVAISATMVPAGAQELGVVEAHGRQPLATLEAIVAEFRTRVVSLGGDFGRIDSMGTTHEMVDESYTYDCGTTETTTETRSVYQPGPGGMGSYVTQSVPVTRHRPKTCTGVRKVEAATLTVVGRAFRTKGTP
jgi:hypothetical protein